MSSGPWQTLGSGFNLLCKRREKIYIWLERTARCVCLCTKTCWDDLVIRNLSVSEGCGAFAEHHWHCLGKHHWVLLRNPDSQRGSQHSRATAACSSPPGGQSSEGRSLLQHLRCAQPTTYKQPPSPRVPPFVYSQTQGTQVLSIFWTMFCIPTPCSFFCIRERVKADEHVLFAVSDWKCQGAGRRQNISEVGSFLFKKIFIAFP